MSCFKMERVQSLWCYLRMNYVLAIIWEFIESAILIFKKINVEIPQKSNIPIFYFEFTRFFQKMP